MTPFSVLVVCEGNICRSPVAEGLLRAVFDEAAGVQVTSAGLRARVGSPVEATMAELLGPRAPTDFAARQVAASMVSGAGLVLAMTRDQRSALVRLAPAALRRTFTLREFAELARSVPRDGRAPAGTSAAELAELVRLAPRYRDRRTAGPEQDDVADPFGRSREEHVQAFDLVQAAVADIAAAVRAAPAAAEGAVPR